MLETAPSGPLYERTLYLVKNRPYSIKLQELSKATGLSVPWLSEFANEKMSDPSIHRVQKLHDALEALIKAI